MQRLTFELIGTRPLLTINTDSIRIRMSNLGFIDPSIILKTDDTVKITRDNHIYTISTNLRIISETNSVSPSNTITLSQKNFGIQELLVNADEIGVPGYVEITNYSVVDNTITIDDSEYSEKEAVIKYLTVSQ